MLKLQYRDSARSVWLVGPNMTLGTATTNDVVVNGDGVASVHGKLNITEDKMEYEANDGNEAFINEVAVTSTKELSLGDVIRVGTSEFVIVDPKDQGRVAPTAAKKPPMNAAAGEETVFRMPAAHGAEQASGWMLQGMHSSLQNKRYPVDGTMVLGRSQECELSFSYDRLSRKHAEFKVIDGILMIKDLGSSNGTFHNGERVGQAKLHPGDTISFDKLEFTVIGPASPAADEEASSADNLNQTVVRAAITPEMIKQAQAQPAKPAAPNNSAAAAPTAEPKKGGPGGMMIGVAVLIVAGLVGAYFLL